MVPNAMELADPPTAGLVFASYPSSTLGPYDEVVQYLDVVYEGVKYNFTTFVYVTADSAMSAGREMGGYPKKIGRIEFLPGSARTAVLERPAGLRICTGTMRPEQQVAHGSNSDDARVSDAPVFSQSADQSASHALRDLENSVDGQPR